MTDGFTANKSKDALHFQENPCNFLGRALEDLEVPHEASDTDILWALQEYDALGRVCAATAINGLRTKHSSLDGQKVVEMSLSH